MSLNLISMTDSQIISKLNKQVKNLYGDILDTDSFNVLDIYNANIEESTEIESITGELISRTIMKLRKGLLRFITL